MAGGADPEAAGSTSCGRWPGLVGMFLNFAALQRLPLADITGFSFVAPIFAVILAALMLKERAGPYRWGAVLVGFGGVLLMIEPHGGVLHLVRAGFSAAAPPSR